MTKAAPEAFVTHGAPYVPTVNFEGAPEGKEKVHLGFNSIRVELTPIQEAIALRHDYLSRQAYNWAVGVAEFSNAVYHALDKLVLRNPDAGTTKGGKRVSTNRERSKAYEDLDLTSLEVFRTALLAEIALRCRYYQKHVNGVKVKKTVKVNEVEAARAAAVPGEEYVEVINERDASRNGLYASWLLAGIKHRISVNTVGIDNATWDEELLMLDHPMVKDVRGDAREISQNIASVMSKNAHKNLMRKQNLEKVFRSMRAALLPETLAPYALPNGTVTTSNSEIIRSSVNSASVAVDRHLGGIGGFPRRKRALPTKRVQLTAYGRSPATKGKKSVIREVHNDNTGKNEVFFVFPGLTNGVINSKSAGSNIVRLRSNYRRLQGFLEHNDTPDAPVSISHCTLKFDGNAWWLSVGVGSAAATERRRKRHKNAQSVVGIDRGARGHNMITASHTIPARHHIKRGEDGVIESMTPIVHTSGDGHDLMNIPDSDKIIRDRKRLLKMQQDLSRREQSRRASNDAHRAECNMNHNPYRCLPSTCAQTCVEGEDCVNFCDQIAPPSAKERKLRKDTVRIGARLTRRARSYRDQAASTIARMGETIAIEDLNVGGMLAAPKPKPEAGDDGAPVVNDNGTVRYARNGRSAKRALARNISKSGFGELGMKIEAHGTVYETSVAKVNRFYPSSRRCSDCGYRNEKTSSKHFLCANCGMSVDRDINAAKNIADNVSHHKAAGSWVVK